MDAFDLLREVRTEKSRELPAIRLAVPEDGEAVREFVSHTW